MSKKLNEQRMVNELKGNSLFFSTAEPNSPPPDAAAKDPAGAPVSGLDRLEPLEAIPSAIPEPLPPQVNPPEKAIVNPVHAQERDDDTTPPRYHDTTTPSSDTALIETIRKAVRQLGKEAATHRFTLEEKKLLRDIVYTYGAQGIKTSENEIARIAIHQLILDYRMNNESSVLARVLQSLNS